MITNKELRKLEYNIKKKMKLISNNEISAKDSKIGILFNSLRKYDEVSYEKLIIQYKNVLK